ncbi:Invasion protein IalB, involved in pathogenesis [Epibacterium ulvae]|uniref:Invasion protein IalB, involved in pathogenesis n=1 Tax=Epibacterium ulvae TaxID=1156985 RepID=A0A1G5PI50_9RHOB|nr:invasion associated locus B family protein [Epibacterium ulvae]SCZ49195.1 Invasion protein IalB, involved in pathogenesis [Epibacterium ulvae]
MSPSRQNSARSYILQTLFPLFTIICLGVTRAFAQDIDGRDTASNWRGTHHSFHGIWNTICDEREENGILKERCYIRWVDVYAPRPQFGGIFTFITPRGEGTIAGHDVMFGVERGTVFVRDGFQITQGGEVIWRLTDFRCLRFGECDFTSSTSDEILSALLSGEVLELRFIDRHGRSFERNWSLEGFSSAYEAYENELSSRFGS